MMDLAVRSESARQTSSSLCMKIIIVWVNCCCFFAFGYIHVCDFLWSGMCSLVYLVFWWRYKDVELYFYFVFRSDPKLFTDDTDIKYCKALNCCKLPKVGAGVNFVPFTRQISLLILFLIHDWNIWPVGNSRFASNSCGGQLVFVNVCFRNPLAKETDCFTQGPKFNFLLLKMQFRCFTVQLKNSND